MIGDVTRRRGRACCIRWRRGAHSDFRRYANDAKSAAYHLLRTQAVASLRTFFPRRCQSVVTPPCSPRFFQQRKTAKSRYNGSNHAPSSLPTASKRRCHFGTTAVRRPWIAHWPSSRESYRGTLTKRGADNGHLSTSKAGTKLPWIILTLVSVTQCQGQCQVMSGAISPLAAWSQ